VQRAR
jgi:hypothetical protein